jgi:predicted P-loop ATPase
MSTGQGHEHRPIPSLDRFLTAGGESSGPSCPVEMARRLGLTNEQIISWLTRYAGGFDVAAARAAGYSDDRIIRYLSGEDSLPNADGEVPESAQTITPKTISPAQPETTAMASMPSSEFSRQEIEDFYSSPRSEQTQAEESADRRQKVVASLANVPEALRAIPHWLVWRSELGEKGKPTKVPYIAGPGERRGSSTNPQTWCSFDDAYTFLLKRGENYNGIGFCLQDSGVAGIDFDDVLYEGGDIAPWADQLMGELNTYSEISPSSKGVKAFVFGEFEGGGKKKKFSDGTGFEFYCRGRFFTVTGNQLAGAPSSINTCDCQALVDRFDHGEIGPPEDRVRQLIQKRSLKFTSPDFTLDLEAFLTGHNIVVLSGPKINRGTTFYTIRCHGSHEGYDPDDGRAFAAQLSSGALSYGCLHESCSHSNRRGNHWDELRECYEPRASRNHQQSIGKQNVAASSAAADDDWQAGLLCGENNRILSRIENFAICFMRHPAWRGGLCSDEFRNKIIVTDAAPEAIQRGVFDDHSLVDIRRWCERYFLAGDIDKIRSGVDAAARTKRIHPVREYLQSLTWDGKSRVATFFQTYFGAVADNEGTQTYLAETAKMFLVSAVARVFQPGCQVDHLLVLEGPQGIYKSNALRTLFGTEYFSDQMPSLDSKDASLQLNGIWCIEFAEFDRLARHEAATVKSFVTRRIDVYRKPYGHEPSAIPRQTVFTATVNSAEYLIDEQNRRFWPVRCNWVDIAALGRDRDQIWGEAYHLYRQETQWWPSTELVNVLTDEQEQREIENPYMARIVEWLEEESSQNHITLDERWLTTARILTGLDIPVAQWKSTDQHVAKAMRKLGYTKTPRTGKARTRFWIPKQSNS